MHIAMELAAVAGLAPIAVIDRAWQFVLVDGPASSDGGHREAGPHRLRCRLECCCMICCMPTAKLTVTVQAASIRKLDRLVRQGRYANRSQATQAALDLLEQRYALPSLEWALAHPKPHNTDERQAWEAELEAIDAALDAIEPLDSAT